MATIKQGGQLERVNDSEGKRKLEAITFNFSSGGVIEMWINSDSVSYLSINEALALKKELMTAIKELVLTDD